MNIRKLLLLVLAANLGVSAVNAEISGSGSPRANCATGEIGGQLSLSGPAHPGIADVELRLDNVAYNIHLSAVTDAQGQYLFSGLCGSLYEISIQTETVPAGLELTTLPQFDDGDWLIVLHDNDTHRMDVDFGFEEFAPGIGCALTLETGCSAASLATELYQCNKPLTNLSMRWSGSEDVRVVAHNGKTGDPVIAEFDNVSPGDLVTVSGMQNASKDVEWEIFNAVTGAAMGKSRFHIECEDLQMDGPEDCLTAQGDGKDNKEDRINDWLLYGLKDASGIVDCSEPVMTETCSFQANGADCESINTPFVLTMIYGSEDCESGEHDQGGDLHCHGSIDPSEPVLVENRNEDAFLVQPGAVFSIQIDGADADIHLSNSGGTRHVKFNASCAKPLAAGDVFGGLQVAMINGTGNITPVDFDYVLSNSGDAVTVSVHETLSTLAETQIEVPAESTLTLHGSAWISDNTTNTVAVTALDTNGDELCSVVDLVTAIKEPAPTCSVMELQRDLHDKELRWTLQADSAASATVERVEISWPDEAGKLKEAKLDGDKFFDQEVNGPAYVIDASNMTGTVQKRRIKRDQTRELKLLFKEAIEGVGGDVDVTVYFEEGCSVSWTTLP